MEGAGSIRHKGNQKDKEGARESNELPGDDMSHHAILRDCAAGVKRGRKKKARRQEDAGRVEQRRYLEIQL